MILVWLVGPDGAGTAVAGLTQRVNIDRRRIGYLALTDVVKAYNEISSNIYSSLHRHTSASSKIPLLGATASAPHITNESGNHRICLPQAHIAVIIALSMHACTISCRAHCSAPRLGMVAGCSQAPSRWRRLCQG